MATLRKLGALETCSDIGVSVGECIYVQIFVIRCEETISATRLADAVQAWAMRHPLLRARIEMRSDGRYFVKMDTDDVRSSVYVHDDVSDWVSFAENEMKWRIDMSDGPLWRVNYVRMSNGGHAIMFTVHHSIMDGVNFMVVGFELVTILNGREDTLPPIGEKVFPCLKQILYKTDVYDGPPPVLDQPWIIPGNKIPPSFGDFKNDNCEWRMLPFQLDATIMDRLAQESKRHGVKMNSTLCSIMALALATLYKANNEHIGQTILIRTPVNLRPFLKIENHHLFECFTVFFVRAYLKPSLEESLADFWDIAKDMNDNFHGRLEKEVFEAPKLDSLSLQECNDGINVVDPAHFALSNLGAFSHPPVGCLNESKNIVVEEAYFQASLIHDSPIAPLVPNFNTVMTLDGRLFWSLGYHEKAIRTELAYECRKLILNFIHHLASSDRLHSG